MLRLCIPILFLIFSDSYKLLIKKKELSLKPRVVLFSSDFPEISTESSPLEKVDENQSQFKGFGKKDKRVKNEKTEKEKIEDMKLESEIQRTNMFQNIKQKREEALETKISQLKEEEDLISSDPSVGAVPEIVANRMLGRMVTFFGIPVFGGLGIFVGAFFYSKKYDLVIPPSVVAYATQVPFILGLLGITYAILSSSWDVETPGSALGFDEAKLNFQRIKEGIERTRQTAELKEEIENEKKKLGKK